MHLVLDGNCQDSLIIGDLNGVRQFLDQFPDEMGMTKVLPPYVFQYQSSSPQDSGISGIVIIAESHISIHTFPARNYLSVDIFSCKAFDVDEAVHKVVSYFNLVEHSYQVFDRGIEYPHDFSLSLPLVIEERLKRPGENGSHLTHYLSPGRVSAYPVKLSTHLFLFIFYFGLTLHTIESIRNCL